MLKSMTGHGHAVSEAEGYSVVAELRTVNGRYFKLNYRPTDGLAWLEQPLESMVRARIHRANVNVTLRIRMPYAAGGSEIDLAVLKRYAEVLRRAAADLNIPLDLTLASLVGLPGVIASETSSGGPDEQLWPVVEAALAMALDELDAMRLAEGQAMAEDFRQNLRRLTSGVREIAARAPSVVYEYRNRLAERVQLLMDGLQDATTAVDLSREIAVFADRCDISEELVRIESHIKQFGDVLQESLPVGKKLEFVIQEMLRETNTIGSKASDLTISRQVIELKSTIERMREMVQNVE